ncbi:P-loop NTPase family protein [Seonamhaeicola marinus]|uniref:SWF/SNF helicase family protein n=1 Tax=Seonamhaeicola marinus TaxID=1912246 RepID=A0A5D0HKR7_9FLAO|nr:SWF/SNF helicase family protein [Seonamhaeicola marinus]TYA71855.1 SWF/SNF helicase family protein [Seonamhaeicola marinus]
MSNFFKNILFFLGFLILAGEIAVRLTYAVSDIPQRKIDEKTGIQKYFPNQEGYWKGGNHKWVINELGWPGELPESYDNLVSVIGDSFIENFMNPNECHQAIYLKQNLPNNNFIEASRSGVSLIEAFEISKQLDSLKPLKHLIYVHDSDFYESITTVNRMKDVTQLDVENKSIVYGEMKSPGFKKILYNFKLAYYFYNRFPLNLSFSFKKKEEHKKSEGKKPKKSKWQLNKTKVNALLEYIKEYYNINDKVLVFRTKSNKKLVSQCIEAGFNVIHLDSTVDDKDWSFSYDHHWTCYGHERVALQVSNYLKAKN